MTTPDPVLPATLPWLDALPAPGLLVDLAENGQVRYANLAAAQHFSTDLPALRGVTLAQLWPDLAEQLAPPGPLPRTFRLHGAGPWTWVDAWAFRVGDLVAVQLSDATAQQAAEVRTGALFDLTVALSRALTAEQAAETVLRQGLSALGAATGSVFVLDEEARELVHAGSLGYDQTYMQGWQRFPVSAPTLLGDAVRGKKPLILSTAEVDDRYPHLRVQRLVPTRAIAALPLLFGGRVVGVMNVGFAGDGPPGNAERTFLRTLAEELAQALERARLFALERRAREEERRARERATLLYQLTAALASTHTPEDVAGVVADTSVPALGATGGGVFWLDSKHEELVLVGTNGYEEGRTAPWRRFSLSLDVLVAECARTGQALFLGTPEYPQRYPNLSASQAGVALPLFTRERLVGVLTYGWDEAHTFDAPEREVLITLAGQCAQALERTLLSRAQDRARRLLARQAALLDQTHDAVFTWELGGAITFWNAGAERLYGFSRDEALGRVSHELLHTDHGELDVSGVEAALREQGEWQGTLHHRTKGGQVVVVDSRHVLVPGEDGAPDLVLETNRDVTARVQAERRAGTLSEVTAALARPLTREDVLRTAFDHALPALGAYAGVVVNVSADGRAIEVEQATGYQDGRARTWQRYALDLPLPATECVREERAVFVGEVGLTHDYPALAPLRSGRSRSLAALPLRFGERVTGALLLSFDEDRVFDDAERQFMGDIAAQCAVALERAQVFEAERTARERASTLARAGELLSAGREPQEVLDTLVGLVVPGLADWCSVALPDGQGFLSLHAIAHTDPAQVDLVRRFHERVPVRVDGDNVVAQVFRGGEGLLIPELEDPAALLPELARDPEFARAARAANARSMVLVPLVARGETMGVLSLISGIPGRFGSDDLSFAQDLARRAAVALDGARLVVQREAALTDVLRERARLLAVLDQLPVAVWLAELPSGRLIGGNAAIGTLMHQGFVPAGEVAEYAEYEGYHPDGRRYGAHEWPLARTLASGEAVVDEEVEVVRPDGTRGTVSFTSALIRAEDGTPVLGVVVGQEVTARKRAELMLKAWGSELERQVAAQTRELRAANEELGAFAYTVSHDLRAPVRHVGSFAGLLRKKVGDDPGLLRYVDVIEQSARRMEVLIDALLGLARAGAAELRATEVNLNLLVDAVRSDLAPDLAGREVTWRVSELPTVRADPGLLRQVLTNLLGNAVKYSRARESAVVEVWAQETPREVTVAVRDNGAGFDPQYAGKLFGVFQRLHHQSEFEGTGVGLANVKRIVEKHGGRVWAEGRPGEGATFFFSLPNP